MTDIDAEAQKDTQLGALARRRQELVKKQVLKLRVPRWEDPKIVISYRPLATTEVYDGTTKAEKTKGDKALANLSVNAGFLVDACLGIDLYFENEEDQHFDDFGPDFAEALGVNGVSHIKTLRDSKADTGLFLADGDVFDHSSELQRWSVSANEEIKEDFAGE